MHSTASGFTGNENLGVGPRRRLPLGQRSEREGEAAHGDKRQEHEHDGEAIA